MEWGEEHTLLFHRFGNECWEATRIHFVHRLNGQNGAVGDNPVPKRTHVHSSLQRVAFPSKDIVCVLPESSPTVMLEFV